jgi:hypothetical protein
MRGGLQVFGLPADLCGNLTNSFSALILNGYISVFDIDSSPVRMGKTSLPFDRVVQSFLGFASLTGLIRSA